MSTNLGYMVALKCFPRSSACVRPAWVSTPPHLSTSSSSEAALLGGGEAVPAGRDGECGEVESGGGTPPPPPPPPPPLEPDGPPPSDAAAADEDHLSGLSCT